MLRDSAAVTRPQAIIPLAMKTMRKSIHGFPLLSYMGMGLRLAVLRAAGAPLQMTCFPSLIPLFEDVSWYND